MDAPEPFIFSLMDNDSGNLVDLEFRGDITSAEIEFAEAIWRPQLARLRLAAVSRGVAAERLPAEHLAWNWREKWRQIGDNSFFFGILCGNEMQGMLTCSVGRRCRLREQIGLPLLFIDFLEVAPWNQFGLKEPRRFEAIGSVLIEQIIEFSRALGCEGRIGLAALKQAEVFYRKCGMTDCGLEQFGAGVYRYFEMTPKQATRFVEG